jgi:hypothetical protein
VIPLISPNSPHKRNRRLVSFLLFRRIISATPAETPTRENQNQKEENGTEISPKESSLQSYWLAS